MNNEYTVESAQCHVNPTCIKALMPSRQSFQARLCYHVFAEPAKPEKQCPCFANGNADDVLLEQKTVSALLSLLCLALFPVSRLEDSGIIQIFFTPQLSYMSSA